MLRLTAIITNVLSMLMILVGVTAVSCSSGASEKTTIKFKQYYIKGESLYTLHCNNCHQKDGSGLGLLFPPIDTSDYMQNNISEVICLIRHGKSGELVINGKRYNKEMPANSSLTDLEIAELTTYIYNSWSHGHGLFEVKDVSAVLKGCQH